MAFLKVEGAHYFTSHSRHYSAIIVSCGRMFVRGTSLFHLSKQSVTWHVVRDGSCDKVASTGVCNALSINHVGNECQGCIPLLLEDRWTDSLETEEAQKQSK